MWPLKLKTIQSLNANSVISEERMQELRKRAMVLVVDDDVQGRLDESLRRSGFSNVNIMRDIERVQDVEPYHVILVDVCGVGGKLGIGGGNLPYEGLSLAEEIKRLYPLKKVIVYSAMLSNFESNYILKTVVDASFEKGTRIDERNKAVDECLKDISDPRKIWNHFRKKLLDADVPITQVANMENYYVRQISGHRVLDQNKIAAFLKNSSGLIGIIKELIGLISLFGGL